jgi:hypothetical protein
VACGRFSTDEEVAATAEAFGPDPIRLPGGRDTVFDTYCEQAAIAVERPIARRVQSRARAS